MFRLFIPFVMSETRWWTHEVKWFEQENFGCEEEDVVS